MTRETVRSIEGWGKANLGGVVPLRAAYRWARELYVYAHLVGRRRDAALTRFVLFAQGRTGGELLRSLINSHPDIRCDGEEVLAHRVAWPRAFVEGRCVLSKARVYGIKVKIYQLTANQGLRDPRRFMLDLRDRGWRVIYLKRSNTLRQAISGLVAEQKGVWHHTTTEPLNLGKVRIDPEELLQKTKEREELLLEEQRVLNGLPHLTVTYEDDLLRAERHQDTLDRAFQYLEVRPAPVATQYVRVTPSRLSELVANYDEVAAVLKRTQFARFLVDQESSGR